MKRTALVSALAAALPACAVTLGVEGTGQALIYPYYTAQSVGSDAFNTYLSVVNHTSTAKALRLRFREGRLGKETLSLNLYLSPNDVWTGAVVPFSSGARLITSDRSCTQPGFAITVAPGEPPFIDFRNDAFSGLNDDGAGTGLDRTREGFVEILEMATLTGASAAAVTHNSSGVPSNCAAISAGTPLTGAPTGGLSGTLTLINVASGMDFTLNAEALDDLATRPYFRAASDPYPDFNAAEIEPISVVSTEGVTFRSIWTRPVDAVSAVLMRTTAMTEYTLDTPTASLTDLVLTLPTRHFYATATGAIPPFSTSASWKQPDCGATPNGLEALSIVFSNREEQSAQVARPDFGLLPPGVVSVGICASAGVTSIRNNALAHMPPPPITSTAVLGSLTQGLPGAGTASFVITPSASFQSGWIRMSPSEAGAWRDGLASTAESSRLRHSSGERTAGAHTYFGLPMLGFSARIFRNGTLRCDAGACQGNYGGAFAFKYRRGITPAG